MLCSKIATVLDSWIGIVSMCSLDHVSNLCPSLHQDSFLNLYSHIIHFLEGLQSFLSFPVVNLQNFGCDELVCLGLIAFIKLFLAMDESPKVFVV